MAIGLGAHGSGQGGDVYALAVDPEGALLDYLEMFYNLRRTGKALTRLGVVATSPLPLPRACPTCWSRARRPRRPGAG